jgi:CRP-like cAMP-binding protein
MNNSDANPTGSAAVRTRTLADVPMLAAQTVEMLRSSHALFGLTADEARVVVGYMRVVTYAKGATLLREGDGRDASEMLLLLDGEVSVDAGTDGAAGGVTIASLGPGSVLGEVALLDGLPRSAQCTALSPVRAAGLSRASLQAMLDQQPRVAAKLMIALSQRITERLRGMGQQLQVYAQLTASLQAEVDRLRAAPRR